MKPTKPYFNNRIFWDVDHESLDYEKRANFIIERVFERGDVEDIRNCRRFYGDQRIENALLQAKFLNLSTIYLAAAVLDRSLTDFRCYKPRLSNPGHFRY